MKKFFFLFLVFIPFLSFAQNLSGKIINNKNEPIKEAYIYNINKSIHSHSNDFGFFNLEAINEGDTISISCLGYESKKIVIQKENFKEALTVVLKEKFIELDQVVIAKDFKTFNQISKIDIKVNPVNSSQEVLQIVPGLFIGQHAGGGKAEQIFLRGFDIDHGTDVNINVDGIPVNMVSHAHGQGYSDLHFIIPETIERIDFGKGTYYADKGNFTTAGYVDLHLKERLDKSSIAFEYGMFNTIRMSGLINLTPDSENNNAYAASELLLTDGPFNSPQNFNRINLMGKYTSGISKDNKLSFFTSYFQSKWDASGQIPQRAVNSGLITRFGAIDDTEGGITSRTNIQIKHIRFLYKNTFVKSRAYFSKYNFELYSNFTFYLNDPLNGDQIKQKESRVITGAESVFDKQLQLGANNLSVQTGLGFRYDNVLNNELTHTLNRKIDLEKISLGDISETNIYGFVNTELTLGKWSINPALRLDYFKNDYVNKLLPNYSTQSHDKLFASPKLNILYIPDDQWQFFLKSGVGFHSNDTRVVVQQNGKDILPAAYGFDLGTAWKPFPRLLLNTTFWYLFLEQEFVYVGDEGIVEQGGKTRRLGIDVAAKYQPLDWFFMNADLNYANGRSIDDPEGADYIPLAPDLTSTGSITLQHPSGFSGRVSYRYMKQRPANEDNSIKAEGYFITDLNLNYGVGNINFGIMILNLFDIDWNETQFVTESRLRNESESTEEIHFTPGTPFLINGKIEIRF